MVIFYPGFKSDDDRGWKILNYMRPHVRVCVGVRLGDRRTTTAVAVAAAAAAVAAAATIALLTMKLLLERSFSS